MRDTLAVAKALADENRLRAMRALRGRELCVCQIIELLGLALPRDVSIRLACEHGRAPDAACGCHLGRDIPSMLHSSGFRA